LSLPQTVDLQTLYQHQNLLTVKLFAACEEVPDALDLIGALQDAQTAIRVIQSLSVGETHDVADSYGDAEFLKTRSRLEPEPDFSMN